MGAATAQARSSSRQLITSGGGSSHDVRCCCCFTARAAVQFSSALTFILGVAFIFVGALVNQQVQGWGLRSVDLLGHLCIGLGTFLLVLSLLGLCAVRSGAFLPLFGYFIYLLVLIAAMLLTAIYAFVENARMRHFLREHWAEIQIRLGTNEEGEDQLSYEEAVTLMHHYLAVIGSVGVVTFSVLMIGFVAAMRQLGLRALALSLLVTLGLLGIVEVAVAFQTYGFVPAATTYLLLVCAGVQAFCATTGLCGFRWLNCECLWWSCFVLAFSAAGLAYVSTATYFWLRETDIENPEHLLLVFGVSVVADFVMISTLMFVLLLYCKRRGAFMEADRVNELQAEFSDYASREGTRGGRGRKKQRLPVAEISAHSHL